jgi:modulator of FtsH protease
MLGFVLGTAGGTNVVMTAFAATTGVFFGMASLSTVIKRDLEPMGKALFIGAMLLLVAMLANLFIGSTALQLTLAMLAAGLFSLFVLVDLKRVRDGQETNYISATMGIFLSLYNVFSSLLQLVMAFGGED